jgi:hypothetical protein
MAKEKQKMTLNVRRRAGGGNSGTGSAIPPEVDPQKLEAFASGAENRAPQEASAETDDLSSSAAPPKVIRDAFTMPEDDHALFAVIQGRCLSIKLVVSKSEILRAGLKFLSGLDDKNLEEAMKSIPKIKTGRPTSSRRGKGK